MKECPKNTKGNRNRGNRDQCSSISPSCRVTLIEATLGANGGENRLYAIYSRQDQGDSPDIVTSMVKVFTFDMYDFLDTRESLYFLSPYVAMNFDVLCEKICESLSVLSICW